MRILPSIYIDFGTLWEDGPYGICLAVELSKFSNWGIHSTFEKKPVIRAINEVLQRGIKTAFFNEFGELLIVLMAKE